VSPLYENNIDSLQDKIKLIDLAIKTEIVKGGYKEVMGSYEEILDSFRGKLNLSENLTKLEVTNRIHAYIKLAYEVLYGKTE